MKYYIARTKKIIVYVGDFENGLFMVIYVPINLKIEAGFRYDNFSNVKNYSSEILKTLWHSFEGEGFLEEFERKQKQMGEIHLIR